MKYFIDCYVGQKALWKVFLVGLMGTIIFRLADEILFETGKNSYVTLVPFIIVFSFWFVWWNVSLWRSAGNTNARVWGVLAMVLVLVNVSIVLYQSGFKGAIALVLAFFTLNIITNNREFFYYPFIEMVLKKKEEILPKFDKALCKFLSKDKIHKHADATIGKSGGNQGT